jgi:hypothetical protein
MAKKLTSNKAKEILHDKSVHGHPLTDKQRRFFGAIAGGAKPYKDGGWLDKYEQGGLVLKKKTKDNYGTKPNVNDAKVSAGPNFVGEGYTAYNWKSPAWGGQFQMGGKLTFLEPTSKKLPRGHVFPYQDPSTERATSIGGVGDEPAYLIPSFKYGKPLQDPEAEFKRTGEHLGGPFKTYQEADEWERTVRHPYVEKGQNIPTPLRRWGKEFQMGGSMPGAVGFTYARTINPAPSNGKYAKKTQASAQNGQEMKYYQDGLDFKPKTISQDGTYVKKPRTDMLTMDEYRVQKANQSTIGKAEPKRSAASKALAIATNPMTALSYKLKGQNIPENFERGERNSLDYAMDIINPFGVAEAITSIPKNISKGEFLQAGLNALSVLPTGMEFAKNPVVKKAASVIKDIPRAENVKEAIGRVAGIPLKKDLPRMSSKDVMSLRQIQELGRMKDLGKSKSEQIKYALKNNLPEEHFSKFFGQSIKEAQDLVDEEARSMESLRSTIGQDLTDEQFMRGSRNLLNALFSENELDDLRRSMRTRATTRNTDIAREPYGSLDPLPVSDTEPLSAREHMINEINRMRVRYQNVRPREDFMRQLLTPEQFSAAEQNLTGRSVSLSGLSDDQLDRLRDEFEDVINSTNREALLRSTGNDISRLPSNFKTSLINRVGNIPGIINEGVRSIDKKLEDILIGSIQDYPYYPKNIIQKVPGLFLRDDQNLKNVSKAVEFAPKGIESGQVFTGSMNTSHSSYLPQLKQVFKYQSGKPQFLGYRPMNSAGYLSQTGYSEKDIVAYLNSEIDEQIKRGVIPKNIERPFQKGEFVVLPQYGVKQNKDGGVVVDSDGYWNPDNWGKPVIIPSNQITMEDVYEPLVGVSDEGDVQYMEPGKNYVFEGDYVTEYPVAKGGISVNQADAQPIKKLDQLLNFTNYNKPTKGGWLDKYQ